MTAQEKSAPAPVIKLGSPFRDNAILQREKDVKHPALRARLDALLLQDPNSDVSKKAIAEYLKRVKAEVARISGMAGKGSNMSTAPLQFPTFPEPGRDGGVKPDTVPTFAYNWCVSPLTPMGVAGVVWVPGKAKLGYSPADCTPELEIYARSLPVTYGLTKVPFLYAQPSATLVPDICAPKIENSMAVEFEQWPKSLRNLAIQLGTAAAKDTKQPPLNRLESHQLAPMLETSGSASGGPLGCRY